MKSPAIQPLGIYVHVPFCRVHCPYCDFYTYPSDRGYDGDFVRALLAEIGLSRRRLDPGTYRVQTVYFGGGTPSLLPARAFGEILDAVAKGFTCAGDMEITVEANPREVVAGYLDALRDTGVNRLSVGVQSFSDSVLRFLGRDHDAAAAEAALAVAADWDNWNCDLIFGSTAHIDTTLAEDLRRLLNYEPDHVSLYQLTVEPRTRFGSLAKRGGQFVIDSDAQAAQYEMICERLEQSGYEHYEVSNFARPGRRARHNAAYWKRLDYIGLGPSASSLIAGRRTQNIRSLPRYLNRLRHNHIPLASLEVLTPQEIRNEQIWLGLRTSDGITKASLSEASRRWLNQAEAAGLVVNRTAGQIALSRRGMALADAITAELLLTESM